MDLRFAPVAALFVSALMLIDVGSCAAASVRMSHIHITLEIPAGWTYERNVTSDGEFYDLEMQCVASGTLAYGLLTHTNWDKAVSNNTLWAELKLGMNEVAEDPEVTYFAVAIPPANTTINGIKACQADLKVAYSGPVVRERLVVLASDEWNMGWAMAFACADEDWTGFAPQITSIINSFTVDEYTGMETGWMLIVALVIAVIVVVAVVAVFVASRRKRGPPEVPAPPAPPPQEPPPQPPPPQQ
ncbi:MAG: hypothetical protein QXT42_02300 [Thermoplasmata archaeon]